MEGWVKSCGEGGLPTATQELEMAIHNHQNLYEQVTTAYTEVTIVSLNIHFLNMRLMQICISELVSAMLWIWAVVVLDLLKLKWLRQWRICIKQLFALFLHYLDVLHKVATHIDSDTSGHTL